MQFIELASPFAIFEGGSAYVLPNVLPETAKGALRRLEEEPVGDVMMSLRSAGQQILSRNTSEEDAAKVWNFFVHYYLVQADPEAPSTEVRIGILRLMVGAPPAEAWKTLRARILADIDDLSGWTRSILMSLISKAFAPDGIFGVDNQFTRDTFTFVVLSTSASTRRTSKD